MYVLLHDVCLGSLFCLPGGGPANGRGARRVTLVGWLFASDRDTDSQTQAQNPNHSLNTQLPTASPGQAAGHPYILWRWPSTKTPLFDNRTESAVYYDDDNDDCSVFVVFILGDTLAKYTAMCYNMVCVWVCVLCVPAWSGTAAMSWNLEHNAKISVFQQYSTVYSVLFERIYWIPTKSNSSVYWLHSRICSR